MIASISSSSPPYVDPPKEVSYCFFRTLEFVNAFEIWWTSNFSGNLHFQVKHLMTKGARIEAGLGVKNQGMLFHYQALVQFDKVGVGYKGSHEDDGTVGRMRKRRNIYRDDEYFKDEKWSTSLFVIFNCHEIAFSGSYYEEQKKIEEEKKKTTIVIIDVTKSLAQLDINAIKDGIEKVDICGIVPCSLGF
ncbi:hypothetical protein PTKIN_Ptkin12aG0042900 [Pterospermum kingtungense]